MHYYRFRPYSELSMKELLYSEMYFASPAECNDPFDSKAFYQFEANAEKWTRLLMLADENSNLRMDTKTIQQLATHICNKCPLSFLDILANDVFADVLDSRFTNRAALRILYKSICNIINIYQPSTRYFVSFSKINNEFLMWSHYAESHKGYCLIFKAIDGKIFQSHLHRKRSIRRLTPNSFAPQMSYEVPNFFAFTDIDYKDNVEQLDAFLHMPVYVSGEAANEAERQQILAQQRTHFFQKGQPWHYEKESRLILHPPPSSLFGEHVVYTKQERLFHYDPSQLVGIIYGANMPYENKSRIKELLQEREEWVYLNSDHKRTAFHFMEFEAKLSKSQRDIEIVPIDINLSGKLPIENKDFDRLYREWREGIGSEKEARQSRLVQVS